MRKQLLELSAIDDNGARGWHQSALDLFERSRCVEHFSPGTRANSVSPFFETQQFCLQITFGEEDLLQLLVSTQLPERPCHFGGERQSGGITGSGSRHESRIGCLDATPRAPENIELPARVEAEIEQTEILLIRETREDILLSTGPESCVYRW